MEEQTQQAEAPVEAPVEQTTQEVVRPEWLPEKFQTPEELAKSYGELSTKIGQKEDDIKEQVMKQLEEEAYSGRPESAGDYQIPDILNEEEAATNPLLKEWAEYAW